MKAGKMIHRCDIYSPGTEPDTRGQEGGETLLMAGVPCSIEPLNSRELEAARQIYGSATHRVRMYGDPKKAVTLRDYLKVGRRKLKIGSVIDTLQNGEQLELLCEERVA